MQNQSLATLRAQRIAAGKCVDCGRRKPISTYRCRKCQDEVRDRLSAAYCPTKRRERYLKCKPKPKPEPEPVNA